ncbi:MAG TPA: hypothetical protein PLC04_07920 [Candidatus Kapabacteria bacterium]|nr:hypothetical protein [Candidatus Kapabacteria bacterium]
MFCPRCSSDKFRVIDVLRERRYVVNKGWIYDSNTDTRRVICRRCGENYLTETKIIYKEQLDPHKLQIKPVPLFDKSGDQ